MRSSAGMYAIDRKKRARSLITAQNFHGARKEMMAARAMREMRVYMECARSHHVPSSALAGTPTFTLSHFHPCNRGLRARTFSIIKH
jgi:hypothetical protein